MSRLSLYVDESWLLESDELRRAHRREVSMAVTAIIGCMLVFLAAIDMPTGFGWARFFAALGCLALSSELRLLANQIGGRIGRVGAVYVVAAFIDLAIFMTAYILCTNRGMNTVPVILVGAAILCSLIAFQLDIRMLTASIVTGLVGMNVSAALFLPLDAVGVLSFAASNAVALIGLAAAYVLHRIDDARRRHADELDQLSRTDPLTRLLNRSSLRRAFDAAASELATVSLAVIDIDEFKTVNDRCGHSMGDTCLRRVARELRVATDPRHEVVVRFGGEEFVVLWHGVDAGTALDRLISLKARIDDLGLPSGRADGLLTVSAGFAHLAGPVQNPRNAQHRLLAAADSALYEAKRNGRNQIRVAVEPESDEDAVTPVEAVAGAEASAAVGRPVVESGHVMTPQREAAFGEVFNANGAVLRRVIMIGAALTFGVAVVIERFVLQWAPDERRFDADLLLLGMVALAMTGAALGTRTTGVLCRWAPFAYLVSTACIVLGLTADRVMNAHQELAEASFVVSVAMIMSLSVAHIEIAWLLPTVTTLASITFSVELFARPSDGAARFVAVGVSAVIIAVAVRFGYLIERGWRGHWINVDRLAELAEIDPMTGLANRRGFAVNFENACAASDGHVGIVLFDIDHLKAYNDTYGHLAGDVCIRSVGDCLSEVIGGPSESGARLGGEEFALILVDESPDVLVDRARDAVEAVADLRIQAPAATGIVTVSAGLARVHPGETVAAALSRADEALYSAKSRGRNCLTEYSLMHASRSPL